MTRETKTFEAIETKVLDAAAGLVECAFSVTGNLDRGNDIIHPGAFAKALANSRPPTVLFSHVADDINQVLGKTVSWNELMPGDPGLPTQLKSLNLKAGEPKYGCVKAQIKFDLDTPSGKLGYTHVAHENLKEWSFAYTIGENGAEMEYPKSVDNAFVAPIRHLKDIDEVLDITLCVVGMNPATSTVAWKSYVGESKAEDIGSVLEALEGFKEDPDPSPDFDYVSAARDAVADIIIGAELTPNPAPAAEVAQEITPDAIPDWMHVGAAQAMRVLATDTVPEDDTPTDVADLLGLTPFSRFEITR